MTQWQINKTPTSLYSTNMICVIATTTTFYYVFLTILSNSSHLTCQPHLIPNNLQIPQTSKYVKLIKPPRILGNRLWRHCVCSFFEWGGIFYTLKRVFSKAFTMVHYTSHLVKKYSCNQCPNLSWYFLLFSVIHM